MDWRLEVVVIPVSDVDRAKRFYEEQVGFHVDQDVRMSDVFRVVQTTPPGSSCSVTFGEGLSTMPPGSVKGLQLCVTDIDEARRELVERGVEVSEITHFDDGVPTPGPGGDWNSFVFFDDPDGNGWAVQQVPEQR